MLLKWNIVEKRLRELIAEDKYLSVKEKEKYQEYKEEQVSVVPPLTVETPESDGSDVLMSDEANASNFHITDDALGVGTQKEKFGKNVEAIKLLKQLEIEHRYATPQEQEILSQYVGWGGLSDAFDERKSNWSTEYQVLRELLSSEEYSMARESTLNSHYTNPVIIRQMYHSLKKWDLLKETFWNHLWVLEISLECCQTSCAKVNCMAWSLMTSPAVLQSSSTRKLISRSKDLKNRLSK